MVNYHYWKTSVFGRKWRFFERSLSRCGCHWHYGERTRSPLLRNWNTVSCTCAIGEACEVIVVSVEHIELGFQKGCCHRRRWVREWAQFGGLGFQRFAAFCEPFQDRFYRVFLFRFVRHCWGKWMMSKVLGLTWPNSWNHRRGHFSGLSPLWFQPFRPLVRGTKSFFLLWIHPTRIQNLRFF